MFFYEAPEDFSSVSTPLTFNSDVTNIQVQILIVDDSESESVENFLANLTMITDDVNVEIIPDQATIFITDNDGKNYYCLGTK